MIRLILYYLPEFLLTWEIPLVTDFEHYRSIAVDSDFFLESRNGLFRNRLPLIIFIIMNFHCSLAFSNAVCLARETIAAITRHVVYNSCIFFETKDLRFAVSAGLHDLLRGDTPP